MYQSRHCDVDLLSLQGNEVQRQKEALRFNQSAIHREELRVLSHVMGLKAGKL